MNDPIADMLIRIKNAQAVLKPTVEVSFSKIKSAIAEILKKEGFIGKIERKKRKGKRVLEIELKYEDKKGVVSNIKRISKPGRRIYIGYKQIKNFPISILSTSKAGLLTNKEAKKQKLGGEVICEIK